MKTHLRRCFKNYCCVIGILYAMVLATSCDKGEDAVILMNPQEICGIRYQGKDINVNWNGTTLTDCDFEFAPVEQDSTKLRLQLFSIIPSGVVDVVVDVVPGETGIRFSGMAENYLYELKVEGCYSLSSIQEGLKEATGRPIIELQCVYKATGDLKLDVPYVFRFDKNCMYCQTGSGNLIEWDGRMYSSTDFVQSVLEHICARIAKEVTALQVVFHADASMDISLRRAGDAGFVPWMTAKYWYNTEYANNMYLEFTDEQVKMFYEEWLGLPKDVYSPPFINYLSGRNLLSMIYWSNEGLGWSIANPYRYSALNMYVKGKGIEGLTEKEKQELLLFQKCLKNVEDQSDWMSWCITMNSERIDE